MQQMQVRDFYQLWEKTNEGYPMQQFGHLPEFCKPVLIGDNPSIMSYLDGWDTNPTGEASIDIATGRRYAEETVAYARKIGSPAFVSFVLGAIHLKGTLKGIIGGPPCFLEVGFFDRLGEIAYVGMFN